MPLTTTDSRNSPSPRSDGKRHFRRRTARKSWSQRDNIENALNATLTSMTTHLPIQKQSTRMRKRLSVEGGDVPPAHCSNGTSGVKIQKLVAVDLSTRSVASPLLTPSRVAELQRTLSDKSSLLLNQAAAPLNDTTPSSPLMLPTGIVADPLQKPVSPHPTKSRRTVTPTPSVLAHTPVFAADSKKRTRSAASGTEGHDADDENDLLSHHLRSSSLTGLRPICGNTKRARSMVTRSSSVITTDSTSASNVLEGLRSEGVIYSPLPRSPTKPIVLITEGGDDIFGSDTTLTSYEDSDDEGSSSLPSSNQAPPLPTPVSCDHTSEIPLPPPKSSPILQDEPVIETLPEKSANVEADQPVETMKPDDGHLIPLENELAQEPLSSAATSFLLSSEDLVIRRGTLAPTQIASSLPVAGPSLMALVLDKPNMAGTVSDDDDALVKQSKDESSTPPSFPLEPSLEVSHPASSSSTKTEFAIPPVPHHRLHRAISPPSPLTFEMLRAAAVSETSSLPADTSISVEPVMMEKKCQVPSSSTILDDMSHQHRPQQPMYRTCLEIMLEKSSVSGASNVLLLKTMLQYNLSNGMQTVRAAVAENGFNSSSSSDGSEPLELDAWGQTIGNGHGLFKETEKARAQRARIEFRRNLVQQAFAKFDQPAPNEWDKSSTLLVSTLSTNEGDAHDKDSEEAVSPVGRDIIIPQRGRGLWSTSIQGMISQLALPPSYICDDCNRSFKLQADLVFHEKLCRGRAVPSGDQGESTTSEPEEGLRSLRSRSRSRTVAVQQQQHGQNDINNNSETTSDLEEGVIRCVCESKEDEGSMIQCDKCYVWLHLDCVGLDDDNVPDEYYCPTCLGLPLPRVGRKPSTRASRSQQQRSRKGSEALPMPKLPRYGRFSSDDENAYSDKENNATLAAPTASFNGSTIANTATSPQVVLNHDWDDEIMDPVSSDLGYDHEYMASLWGISTRPVFKQRRAPALMLDGSTSLDSDLGGSVDTHPMVAPIHQLQAQVAPVPTHGLDFNSEDQSVFHDSTAFNYLSTDAPFENNTLSSDGFAPELLLNSEDTIESEGLRTPVERSRDDIWEGNDLDDLDDVDYSGFSLERSRSMRAGRDHHQRKSLGMVPLEEHFPRELLTDNVIDWFFEQNSASIDDLDLDGIIDLGGAETALDEY